MSFNKIILVGNLTRDIELKYTAAGVAISSASIATSRKFTKDGQLKEEVCYVDITFFGILAETANQYLHKGSKILAEGRLNFNQWVDQNGQKRSKHSVVVETMQMLGSKGGNRSGTNSNPAAQNPSHDHQAPQAQSQSQQAYQAPVPHHTDYQPKQQEVPKNIAPALDIDEEEIPF